MKILGIDYGEKRVGVAISDEGQKIAFPLKIIFNDKKLFDNFADIIKDHNIKKVILGESKNYQMQDNLIMKDILKFKSNLEDRFNLEVVLHSEILSSSQAELIQGKNKMLDASAAAIILQSYLDSKNNS